MENAIKSGVYSIKNKVNGKLYVGSSINIGQRWYAHKKRLKAGRHENSKLQRAWVKYGKAAFGFHVIETVEDVQMLIEREQFWIDIKKAAGRDSGYNICPTAGNCLGMKHSKETRQKLSDFHTGMKHTQKTKDKLREIRLLQGLPRIAPRTEEYRAKISATLTGRKSSKETCLKISAALKGHKTSAETRLKISLASAGRLHTPEAKAKMAVAATGRKHSAETKAKMGVFRKGKKISAESIAKMQKGRRLQRERVRAEA